jgi:hypothetical protein
MAIGLNLVFVFCALSIQSLFKRCYLMVWSRQCLSIEKHNTRARATTRRHKKHTKLPIEEQGVYLLPKSVQLLFLKRQFIVFVTKLQIIGVA